MKKILFGLVALALGALTSCTNDDIEIISGQSTTFSVDPSLLFSSYTYKDTKHDIEIAEQYRKFNSVEEAYIHVRSLIYNKATGALVDSISVFVENTNLVTKELKLPAGDYCAITTLAFAADENYMLWKVSNRETLSAAKLFCIWSLKDEWCIVSQAVNYFSVSGESGTSVRATPKPLGSLVYYYMENFQYKDSSTTTISDNGIRTIGIYALRKGVSYNLDPDASNKVNYAEETGTSQWYYLAKLEPANFNEDWTFFKSNLYGYYFVLETQQKNVFGIKREGENGFAPYGEQDRTYEAGKMYLAYWNYFEIGNPYLGEADNNHW
ncbi:MAG: hypothetical protein ACI4AH_00710 [Muribaculaceae bacterium]